MIATVQANTADQRSTIFDLRSSDIRLEDRVRGLKTLVGQRAGGGGASRHPSSDLSGTPVRPPSRPGGRGRGGKTGHEPVMGINWGRATGDWSGHVRVSLGSRGSGEELANGKVGSGRGEDPRQPGEQVLAVCLEGRLVCQRGALNRWQLPDHVKKLPLHHQSEWRMRTASVPKTCDQERQNGTVVISVPHAGAPAWSVSPNLYQAICSWIEASRSSTRLKWSATPAMGASPQQARWPSSAAGSGMSARTALDCATRRNCSSCHFCSGTVGSCGTTSPPCGGAGVLHRLRDGDDILPC